MATNDPKTLAAFIATGQYSARSDDERVTASKLVNDGGPEVKAAAKIALASPADQLEAFLNVGQYMADRKDKLADTHNAQMQRLIAEASGIAATARKNSWLAAKAAADAHKASTDAQNAANQAANSAHEAQGYAHDADVAATSAENSAEQARKSVATARAAADAADQSAADATESAAQAEFNANYARTSAAQADQSAADAHDSATAADKSAKEAQEQASQAWQITMDKRRAEEAEARRQAEAARKAQAEANKKTKHCHYIPRLGYYPDCLKDGGVMDPPINVDPQEAAMIYGGLWTLSGGKDIQDCIENPTLGKCAFAAMVVIPGARRTQGSQEGRRRRRRRRRGLPRRKGSRELEIRGHH
ncbi:ALF repeat-containing protein [Streptomyces lasalocidi]